MNVEFSKFLIVSIFIVKSIPRIEPMIVPLNPIKVPTSKKILKIEIKSTLYDKKSNQYNVTKKFLLHLLFDNLPSFFSKTAYGRFYFNFKSALFP